MWNTWYGAISGKADPCRPGTAPPARVARELVRQQPHSGLEQRHVDRVAAAGVQGGEDPERGPHPGSLVDDRGADPHSWAVGLAGHAHQPAECLHQRVVTRPVTQRARTAECPDVAVHESRVSLPELVWAEPEPGGGPRPQALQEHVGVVDESQQYVAPSFDVECERPLVQIRRVEHHARPLPERGPPRARFVAPFGMLDLDDVRAERAQDLRTVGARQRARHVDDTHSCEG